MGTFKKGFRTAGALAAGFELAASVASATNIETAGKARFTLLTDRMVRCEWSENGVFEDRPSLTFINRSMPDVGHVFERRGTGAVITTPGMRLEWTGGPFSETNLTVNGVAPLAPDEGNLLGTMRTLDGRCSIKDLLPRMEQGILSRRGVTVVDDTRKPLFVKGGDYWGRWVAERPKRPDGAYRDLTVFAYGRDYKGCLGDYVKVAGRIPLPPRWAFGYWWSRFWNDAESDYRQIVREMDSVGIPMDVCVIEMYWHENWNIGERPDLVQPGTGQMWGWGGYTWNRRYFPDPAGLFRFLHEKGLKAPLNMHPACGIPECEEVYPRFARDYGWKGRGAIPFRADEERWAEVYFKDVVEPLEALGADFFWLDWQQQPTAKDKPALSNTFWLNHLFATHDAARVRPDGGAKRPVIYHRWGGLGSHRYQVGFSGDGESSWRMLEAIPWFTATASNVGYGYWGHDLGGHNRPQYARNENGELFTRWMQCGVFTPIFRTHPSKDSLAERRPWKYPDHFFILREAYRLRYRLAPYIYTAARQAYDTGVCLCRPMYYDWPEADAAYDAANQYMFGDDILVAPVTKAVDPVTKEAEVDVWLPEGAWYDVSRGELAEGGRRLKRGYTVEETPWFVKAGAVIPMYPDSVNRLGHPGTDDLVLFCAPGAGRASASVYEDAGDNADYATNFRRTAIRREGNRVTIAPRRGAYTLKFPLAAAPLAAKVNGKACAWEYNAEDLAVVVKTPPQDGSRETVVELVYPDRNGTVASRLSGLKGGHTRVASLTEDFRLALAGRRWPKAAANLPASWQVVWKTRDAIAAHPADAEKLLAARDAARAEFKASDWPNLKSTLREDFRDRMERFLKPSRPSEPAPVAARPSVPWTKFPGNPVLGDPKKLGTCFDVNIVKGRTAVFDMYFSWRPKKSIAVSSSDDGVNWTQPEIVLRPNPATDWEQDINRACVVRKDGKWHMWYTGQAKGRSWIGYALSEDGRSFRRLSEKPVLSPEGALENMSVMNPSVLWDGKRGVWRMWYSAGETYEPNVNCYAESKDGFAWVKSPHNPVLAKGTREWEKDRVGGCEVHPLPDGTYVMFYIGYKDIDTAAIGAAVSTDGIAWRRLKANPLVVPSPGAFDASACYKPSVFRDAARDRWLLWYNGRNGNKGEYIGLAVKDGLDLGGLE